MLHCDRMKLDYSDLHIKPDIGKKTHLAWTDIGTPSCTGPRKTRTTLQMVLRLLARSNTRNPDPTITPDGETYTKASKAC